jgi:uncharacterized delta-60 repeat protein
VTRAAARGQQDAHARTSTGKVGGDMDVKLRLVAAALAALAVCAPPAGAAPGDLDASFSGDGRVSTLTSPDTFVARAVAIQPDGRIVVAGYSCDTGTCGPTGDSSFRLMRYTPDGGLDTDFGAGGMVTTAVGVGRAQAFDVVVRGDGRIVAGGVASADAGDPGSFALVGYRPNGTLDTGFGAGGRVITRVGEGFDAISDLVPVGGDRVVAVGQAAADGRDRFALARYDRDGKPDHAFGDSGTFVVPASATYAYGAAGAALPDGRVVAVGASGSGSATESLRFSGTPVGFSGSASPPWTRPIGASYSYANAAVALGDGRVLSAGVATERTGHPAMALARTSAEGALDRSWDGDGLALARARDATVATDVLLDPEGRAVAAGHSSAGPQHDFALARFDAAGAPDRSFGGGGMVLTSFPGVTVARATALARQADGKLVVAGIACASGSGPQCSGGSARLALARYDVAPGAAAAPPPGGAVGGTVGRGSTPFVGLPSRLVARRGRIRVRVRCLQAARCRGTLTLRRLRTGRPSRLVGSRRASIPARKARTVVVRVRRGSLGARRRARVRMEFAGRDATGKRRRIAKRVPLRRR